MPPCPPERIRSPGGKGAGRDVGQERARDAARGGGQAAGIDLEDGDVHLAVPVHHLRLELPARQTASSRREDFTAAPSVECTPAEAAADFPHSHRVVLAGFFRAEPSVTPVSEERTIRLQGASVLYGMGREIIRAPTGRGPHRPGLVPTVSFCDPPAPPAP